MTKSSCSNLDTSLTRELWAVEIESNADSAESMNRESLSGVRFAKLLQFQAEQPSHLGNPQRTYRLQHVICLRQYIRVTSSRPDLHYTLSWTLPCWNFPVWPSHQDLQRRTNCAGSRHPLVKMEYDRICHQLGNNLESYTCEAGTSQLSLKEHIFADLSYHCFHNHHCNMVTVNIGQLDLCA